MKTYQLTAKQGFLTWEAINTSDQEFNELRVSAPRNTDRDPELMSGSFIEAIIERNIAIPVFCHILVAIIVYLIPLINQL